jgi:CO/xanthine dehydrogenase FAD-binding subunit
MPLQVVRPDSVKAATKALAADGGAFLLGGGTLLVRARNSGDLSIKTLVLSDGLKFDRVAVERGRAKIGAAVTMAEILAHPELAFLHDVAREIGGPAVRAMATVGGNLFAHSPYGDFAVALLALGAKVAVEDAEGSGTIDLEDFLKDRAGRRDRIVKSVSFKLPAEGAFRFAKVSRRHPHGASVLSIAALLPLARGRVRKGARVAYGAMAPTAIRAHAVEEALQGKKLDAATIADAAKVATEGTEPATDAFASAWYRSNVLPIHLARLLER